MTVWENIVFPLQSKKIKKEVWEKDAEKLIQKLNLQSLTQRKSSVLSGGEQQRVALARALLIKPRFILLDEPLSQLDEKLKSSARGLIQELNQEFKIPFILVTHDPRDAQTLASDILVLENGKCKMQGATHEILKKLALI
jgi:ABC-type sugar transport system ATPase subunit